MGTVKVAPGRVDPRAYGPCKVSIISGQENSSASKDNHAGCVPSAREKSSEASRHLLFLIGLRASARSTS